MTKVKICGLMLERDIEYANLVEPDYVGFIFVQRSRRYVSPDRAAELKKNLRPNISAVGVFVDAPISASVSLVKSGVIDVAQLHGKESHDYIDELTAQITAPVIKAFAISCPQDMLSARITRAHYPVLDNGEGGTGRVFDWGLVKSFGRDYFLAGGLTPENVAKAATQLRPYAIDVSSGVETDGRKDLEKMRAVVERVRNLE